MPRVEKTIGHGGARDGAGRPVAEDPRNVNVVFKVTSAERERLAKSAASAEKSLSDWIRSKLLTSK